MGYLICAIYSMVLYALCWCVESVNMGSIGLKSLSFCECTDSRLILELSRVCRG